MIYKKPFKLSIVLLIVSIVVGLFTAACAIDTKKQDENIIEFEVPKDEFDEPNLRDSTIGEAFSLEQSLYRLGQVREGLDSFKKLTEQSKTKLTKDILEQVGNTGWEIQTLGFYNWANTIEGTLIMQNYQIRKLEFALSAEKYEKGEATKEDAEKAQEAYENAKNELQRFLDSYSIAD